jgi:hypothetical protein
MIVLKPIWVNGQEKKQYKVACIGFYNLENLFDTLDTPGVNDYEFTPNGPNNWNSAKYQKKLSNMAEVIAQIGKEMFPTGPAILGVCEVENRLVLNDLIRTPRLKPSNYSIIHYDSPDRRGVDVAMLYRPEFFRVTATRPVRLAMADDTAFRTRDQLVVSGLLDGEPLHVIVNHWPSRSGGELRSAPKRAAAARLTKSIVDSIHRADPSARILIMGDLNDDPTNESVAEILGAKGKPDKLRKGDLFNPMWQLYKDGIGSLAYRDSWNLFDQIILSEPLVSGNRRSFTFLKANVFDQPFVKQQEGQYAGYPWRTFAGGAYSGGYSDHLPVYVFLVKEKK